MFGSVHRHKPEQMVRSVHKLLNEADAVVHFNGKKFDVPTLNKEFLLNGLSPPSPYRQIDLLQTCRRQFKFASNKLDYVSQALGEGAKVEHKGMELWNGCMAGDEASWRLMERYNKGDVRLTERMYDRLLPWIQNHPNVNLYGKRDRLDPNRPRCPNCGGSHVTKGKWKTTKTRRYLQWQCSGPRGCGSWFPATKAARSTT